MGKRYYCDYCDKSMSCTPTIIKTHNKGMLHQRARLDHYQHFKDPEEILQEECKKKPCTKFPNCQFGSICRFSHYSPEDIQSLQNYVSTKRLAQSVTNQPCFQDLYDKLQTEKSQTTDENTVLIDDNGVTHQLPWSYNTVLNGFGYLPPSVRPITLDCFKDVSFSEWG